MTSPRLLALHQLLSLPDPQGMTRGHRLTCEGKADRAQLKVPLFQAHLTYRAVQQEEEHAA